MEEEVNNSSLEYQVPGLDNLGNTCYMNCSLQALYATKEFREYLLRGKYSEKVSEQSLHLATAHLFQQMANSNNKKSIEPKEFWNTFTAYKKQFEGRQQHDAQECLRFIIDGIHEEVNVAKKRGQNRKSDGNESWKTPKSSEKVWKQFNQYSDDSFLVRLFVGQFKYIIECSECQHKSYSWEHFWDISLPLPEKEDEIDVQECANLYIAKEVLENDSMPFCTKCQQKRKSVKKTIIKRTPFILIIQLKRFGNDGQKIDKKVKINENLEFKDLMYELYACISHQGISPLGGHYVCHCRHTLQNNQWFYFDDEDVRKEDNIDFNDMTNAYILFYRKKGTTHNGGSP